MATTIPASCTWEGWSPVSSPTTTGTITLVARIGATTLIVPIAIER